MKVKKSKKITHQLRHAPLSTEMERPVGKLRAPKVNSSKNDKDDDDIIIGDNDDDTYDQEEHKIQKKIGKDVSEFNDADRTLTHQNNSSKQQWMNGNDSDDDEGRPSNEYDDDDNDANDDGDNDYDDDNEDLIEFDDGFIKGSKNINEDEEALVEKFLHANRYESRNLADIIMEKLKEKKEIQLDDESTIQRNDNDDNSFQIPAKVVEVYTAVGKMLHHYRSGKLPKALKMLPHLKNWEQVLWLTRPDEWSPAATYASTRIFASNLNEKMAQRYMNLVLLEKCRDDIRSNRKLNYYYYLSIKKALYKPSAFYKGFLLPLAQSGTCSLRESAIIGSALSKYSIPSIDSAAVLLRLADLNYSGSTSMFIKILLNKKYALPRRVIDALLKHYYTFEKETRVLPVIWHQSLLIFVQRYKFELNATHKERIKQLVKIQFHHQITNEILRELSTVVALKA